MPRPPGRQKCACGSSSRTSAEVETKKNKYTCPVCLEFLLIPVYQCTNGHLICDECVSKVKTCPVCRDSFHPKKIRNLIVEEMIRDSLFDCKNADDGCSVRLKFDQVRDHDLDCRYSSLNYCEALGLTCEQKHGVATVVDHLQTVHRVKGVDAGSLAEDILVDIQQLLPKIGMDHSGVVKGVPIYFTMNGRIFFLKSIVDLREKLVSWMLCTAGSQKSAESYVGNIYFLENALAKNFVSYNGPIYCFDKKFEGSFVLSVPLKSLPFQESGIFGRTGRRNVEYSVTLRVSISIESERKPRGKLPASSSSMGHPTITSVFSPMLSPRHSIADHLIFDGLRAMVTSSSEDTSSDSDDNYGNNNNSNRNVAPMSARDGPSSSTADERRTASRPLRNGPVFVLTAQGARNSRERPAPYHVPNPPPARP